MRTGTTRCSEDMNTVSFFCINFELISTKQTSLRKQGAAHKNKYYKWLVHISLHSLI